MQNHINVVTYNLASQDAENLVYKNLILLWAFFVFAIFSFLTTLGLPYQGEEAVYTITSLEMWYQKEWFVPLLYGNDYGRPPLFNWGIIPLATILGWDKMLVAARIVTSLATLGSTLVLFGFTDRIFRNKTLALLTSCIYLSGDLLLRRGWLAYADPVFSFFVFLAIASLYLAVEKKQIAWLCLACIGLSAAYLAKAFTAYIFYAGTFLVLLFRHPNSKFLWSRDSLLFHALAVFFVLVWDYFVSQGAHNESMVGDILTKFNLESIFSYFIKLLLYPLDTLYHWLPGVGVLLYFWLKDYFANRLHLIGEPSHKETIKNILWIFLINYIPYWLAPFSRTRYLLPLYPLIAILLGYAIYHLNPNRLKIAVYTLWGCLIIKYGLGLWFFPYYEQKYRGSYQIAAQEINSIVGMYPLYTNNVSATGLSVTAELDVLRLPLAPLKRPPAPDKWQHGFVLEYFPKMTNVNNTEITKIYSFGGSKLYLLCRGNACRKNVITPETDER